MRIGIDARMYGAEATTGIGEYIEQLFNTLQQEDNKNEYVLFMRSPAYENFVCSSPRVKKVLVNIPWYGWREQLILPSIISGQHCDIVHFPHFNVPILYKGKYIVTIHDLTPRFFPGHRVQRSRLRKLAYTIVFNIGIKRAHAIIVISNYTKKLLLKYSSVKEGKIKVVYLGADNNKIQEAKDSDSILKKFSITKKYLLYVGVWRDHKNIPGLVQAFQIVREKYNFDCQLVLCGKPDDRYPEIIAAIHNSKFHTDIITPGFVSNMDLAALYSNALLNVLVSFAEGFGLVAVEAARYGTPTVSSNTTSVPEILGDGTISCNPSDPYGIAEKIVSVLKDQSLREDLVQKSRNKISEYKWSKCARETLRVYEQA